MLPNEVDNVLTLDVGKGSAVYHSELGIVLTPYVGIQDEGVLVLFDYHRNALIWEMKCQLTPQYGIQDWGVFIQIYDILDKNGVNRILTDHKCM